MKNRNNRVFLINDHYRARAALPGESARKASVASSGTGEDAPGRGRKDMRVFISTQSLNAAMLAPGNSPLANGTERGYPPEITLTALASPSAGRKPHRSQWALVSRRPHAV